MANNQYINKVVYGNQTLMDLTGDTVSADKILRGYTAHDASGASIVGTYEGGGGEGYTINLTTSSSELYGQSIVVSYEGQRITTIQFSNDGTASIVVQEEGAYNFAVSYGGLTYYCDVNVVSAIVTYNETIYYYPNGSIVTPLNDVQIWISCADVRGRDYTTLAEVFTDSELLATLMASENAVNYLVRSKQFIKSEALVPIMTSNTTPEGVCFGSSIDSANYDYYKAFDKGSGGTYSNWASARNLITNQYVGYEFTEPKNVSKVVVSPYSPSASDANANCKNVKLQCEENGSWVDVGNTFQCNYQQGDTTYSFPNAHKSTKWRLFCVDNWGNSLWIYVGELQFYSEDGVTENQIAMTYIGANDYASNTLLADTDWNNGIQNSTYFESVDNVKVPTMTSATTPSGIAFDNGSYDNNNPAWYSFSDQVNKFWVSPSGSGAGKYFGYEFTSAVKIFKAVIDSAASYATGTYAFNSAKIQATNDNDWSTPIDLQSYNNSGETNYSFIFNNPTAYSKYRWICTTYSGGRYYGGMKLQFYGRQNGGVQTWLRKAGITDKTYTTLSEVFADSATLSALMANKDAVDYLVTCKGWATEICSNQSAMSYIGLNNYCADTLLADETWLNAIWVSPYKESVFNVKAPAMTSNNTPSGYIASALTEVTGAEAYHAFNGNDADFWAPSNTNLPTWVQIKFPSNVDIYGFGLKATNANRVPSSYSISASTNGSDFTTLYSDSSQPQSVMDKLQTFSEKATAQYFRMTTSAVHQYIGVFELQFYGREDV